MKVKMPLLSGIIFTLLFVLGSICTLHGQSTDELLLLLKPNVVTLHAQIDDLKVLGHGMITGEQNGNLFIVTAASLVYKPGPNAVQPEKVVIHLFGHSTPILADLEEIDLLNNLARLSALKPSNYVWEKLSLPVQYEVGDPTFAFDPQKAGLQATNVVFDNTNMRILSQNYQDILCYSATKSSEYLGIPIMTQEGFAGLTILLNDQNWVAKKMSVIQEFMTQGGRFENAFQLETSAYAKKIHKSYKTTRKPRVFLNLRGGWAESVSDFDPRETVTYNRNPLAGTFGFVAGIKWPKSFLLGADLNVYGGADYVSAPAQDASYFIRTSGIGTSLLLGYEWQVGRWHVVPSAQTGYIFFKGRIDYSCRGAPNCQDEILIADENGLFYGGSLTNYWAIARGLRFGVEINYRAMDLEFVQSSIGIMGSLEFSVLVNRKKLN